MQIFQHVNYKAIIFTFTNKSFPQNLLDNITQLYAIYLFIIIIKNQFFYGFPNSTASLFNFGERE